ncbi:MAG: transcriptional regulator, GntR family [Polaromonas sp.]|jgi:DNA-binding FadR family transcriptional regulator|nr:transcriptional regulator, GntR family [Polaromonas sp.]
MPEQFTDSIALFEESLLDNLRTSKWRAGHRIPTERDFSTTSGLSRSTIRRVLAGLKARGLITQTVGSGTYVSSNAQHMLSPAKEPAIAHGTSPAELMGARLVLEPAIIEMVIAHANSGDFLRMEDCCTRAEAATTLEDFEHWDSMLHEVIADAAHNTFITSVFRLMNQARSEAEWGMLKRRSATPERRLVYQHEHRALVSALKQRDTVQAKALSTAHLVHVRQNMLGY